MMNPIVIIGGGITGLTAAYRLEQQRPDLPIILLESGSYLGGKLLSERFGRLLIEGGADSFLSRKPRGVGLCEELGLADRLYGRRPENRKTYVKWEGDLHRLPEGLSGFIPTDMDALAHSTLLSAAGKARVAQESDIPAPPGDIDESLASFITRRFGSEAFDLLIEPLMSGIYAGNGELLSLAATFPHLREIEKKHGSLLRGLAAKTAVNSQTATYPPFVTLPQGVGELITTLTGRLQRTAIHTSTVATAIRRAPSGYTVELAGGERLSTAAVIVALPAFAAATLTAPLDDDLSQALSQIPYASSATISLAFNQADLPAQLDGYGYVIPRKAKTDLLACTWTSQKWTGRAPDEVALLRVFAGRFGRGDILATSDAALLALARAELAETLGIKAEPFFTKVYRWEQGMPQYNLGHLDRLQTIEQRQADLPGIFLAGAAYRGVGIPDCIHSGEQAAQAAAVYCGEKHV